MKKNAFFRVMAHQFKNVIRDNLRMHKELTRGTIQINLNKFFSALIVLACKMKSPTPVRFSPISNIVKNLSGEISFGNFLRNAQWLMFLQINARVIIDGRWTEHPRKPVILT